MRTRSSVHSMIRITVQDARTKKILWDRTFGWIPADTGWGSFTNHGAYIDKKFHHDDGSYFYRSPYDVARDWTVSQQQLLSVISAAAWWINNKTFDLRQSNCTHFLWALLGAAGINPNVAGNTSGSTTSAPGVGLGKDHAKAGVSSLWELSKLWLMKLFPRRSVAPNVGEDVDPNAAKGDGGKVGSGDDSAKPADSDSGKKGEDKKGGSEGDASGDGK